MGKTPAMVTVTVDSFCSPTVPGGTASAGLPLRVVGRWRPEARRAEAGGAPEPAGSPDCPPFFGGGRTSAREPAGGHLYPDEASGPASNEAYLAKVRRPTMGSS